MDRQRQRDRGGSGDVGDRRERRECGAAREGQRWFGPEGIDGPLRHGRLRERRGEDRVVGLRPGHDRPRQGLHTNRGEVRRHRVERPGPPPDPPAQRLHVLLGGLAAGEHARGGDLGRHGRAEERAEQVEQSLAAPRRVRRDDLVAQPLQQQPRLRDRPDAVGVDRDVAERGRPASSRCAGGPARAPRRPRTAPAAVAPSWRRRARSRRGRRAARRSRATVRVSTPSCTRNCSPSSGACDTRPRCGLRPTRPQHDAGMRSEPPPSLPCASGTMPAATAAALPPDEPPGVRAGSQGFRVRSVTGRIPHSGIAVVPTTIAPAARRRRTTLWSCVARTSRMSEEPHVRRSPVTALFAFTATGTPASGRGSPAVTSAAAARAPASSTSTNAPRCGSSASIRASESSTSSRDVTSPAPTRRGELGRRSGQQIVAGHAAHPTGQ